MIAMAKKPKPPVAYDARAVTKPIRIRGALVPVAESRAGELVQDLTQYVNDSLRMRLEAEGFWPPPPAKK